MTQLAMLTGVALIIFVIELQIPNPFPIPGVKLGMGVPIYLSFLFVPGSLAGAFTGACAAYYSKEPEDIKWSKKLHL